MKYWLKPIFIVLGVFMLVVLLMNLDQVFPTISWSSINNTIIPVLPWLVAFGLGLFVLVYVMGRN